jgi:hypothetical protein
MGDLRHGMAAAGRMDERELDAVYRRGVEVGTARELAYGRARREVAARSRGGAIVDDGAAASADVLDGYDGAHRAGVLLMLAATRAACVATELARLDRADDGDEALFEWALVAARDTASSALALAQLALDVHARAVGYDASAWVRHALERAWATLLAGDPDGCDPLPGLVGQILCVGRAFAVAARAIADDGMRVADELATGLGRLLALLAITGAALDA